MSSFLNDTGIRDIFLGGVYNDTYEVLTDGGYNCFLESSLGFKTVLIYLLVYIFLNISDALSYLHNDYRNELYK